MLGPLIWESVMGGWAVTWRGETRQNYRSAVEALAAWQAWRERVERGQHGCGSENVPSLR